MGAQPSTFSHELKNPTRTLSSQLHLNDKQRTFTFIQHMQKAVGEQQTLRTRITYTGTLHNINTDITDKGRTIKGCPVYRLRTERVRFEVEWGNEWWQCKKGTLTREDILAKERRRGAKGVAGQKCTAIVTSTVTPPASALFSSSTAVTAPPSPSSTGRPSPATAATASSSSAASSSSSSSASSASTFLPIMLPPAMDGIPRGFSHSAPLSPAPLSLTERQRSHIDVETSGETHVQPITADNKIIKPAASSTTLASASTITASPASTTNTKVATSHSHTVTVTYHGTYHAQLQAATSLEEMADLLQADTSDWTGTFGMGGLELHCRVLSEEVRVEYWRPKFEYLWAQVADECPVIMALSNVFHDQQMQEMYLPRTVKG